MNKAGTDPKVKKTLLRNYELKVKPNTQHKVVREVESCRQIPDHGFSKQETVLSEPTLCSSAALANYLSDVKKSLPPPLSAQDLTNVDKGEMCLKMTKKLNFHFNDTIYRNLVELNTNIENHKTKKERKPLSSAGKRDLEPNIEDFCDQEKEPDVPPKVPVLKPKIRPVKIVEQGQLHKLMASFERL